MASKVRRPRAPLAQFGLGRLYEAGLGVAQSYPDAYMWLDLASSRSGGDARLKYEGARLSLAAKMTAAQIADAERLAREWMPSGADTSRAPAT